MESIIDLVKTIKATYPSLRFCQLMYDAATLGGWNDADLYFCEDETLVEGLKRIVTDGFSGGE